jgi:uncharacterized repeat protein (TIGR01451 family)
MTLSTADTNGWVAGAGNTANAILAGTLPTGLFQTIDIVLTVDAGFMGTTLTNWAEIAADDGDDKDSTPDTVNFNVSGETNDLLDDNVIDNSNGDEDDHDPAQVTITQVYDLALRKVLSGAGPFMPGDDATFTIMVYNQGTIDAANIEITDYIPSYLSLSTADTNGWTGGPTGNVTNTIAALPAG